MKVSVTRSGGFAGLRRTWAVTVDEQPDRYVYEIRYSRRRVTLPEQQLTGVWKELVDRVREAESAQQG
jgi:hypothetical protein